MRCAARKVLRNVHLTRFQKFSTTHPAARQPNPPLNLDPSLQALLQDVDIALIRHKAPAPSPLRELDVLPSDISPRESSPAEEYSDAAEFLERKSPAAAFGSRKIGSVLLPLELQNSINTLISESDKPLLHVDAERLFKASEGEDEWNTNYDTRYRSRAQASKHSERDGTAFATVALPAHYSAIKAVLEHLKHRMGPGYNISRVIDWGAGTGSGLWAALHTFQQNIAQDAPDDPEATRSSDSTIESYLAIEKRPGLTTIGKRLLLGVKADNITVSWQKSFHEDDCIPRSIGHDTLALSAFHLSSLPTHLARKQLVKEMWESGAHTMVLIDHNNTTGFENIAEAREVLLTMGRKEMKDPDASEWPIRGSHVVAPCPHDGECPLYDPGSTRLVCGFSQRLQTPPFVRRTKHSKAGYEDIGYSYVIVRRGERPTNTTSQLGRVGAVGRRQMVKEMEANVPIKELALHDDQESYFLEESEQSSEVTSAEASVVSRDDIDASLRQEAFYWPRLVFPPLKKSGHIILDSCTAEGKIMRLTIPKSQGKQPFYDARKSSWGDIFPHTPKNQPQERVQTKRAKREGSTTPTKGSDIGKRRGSDRQKDRISYESLAENLKESRKKSGRDVTSKAEKGALPDHWE
ncbi:37S ribosomal protein S22 [Paramarasmius palmivorus]|uniref:37S ribosomal protein S22 n=1 Tax=Paramarasmius palmivorus TaxID=297713 RepID=A0AAW0E5A8_9AGAR